MCVKEGKAKAMRTRRQEGLTKFETLLSLLEIGLLVRFYYLGNYKFTLFWVSLTSFSY